LLEKQPDRRPASARAAVEELATLRLHSSCTVEPPRAHVSVLNRRLLRAATGGLGVLGVVVLGLCLTAPFDRRPAPTTPAVDVSTSSDSTPIDKNAPAGVVV